MKGFLIILKLELKCLLGIRYSVKDVHQLIDYAEQLEEDIEDLLADE